ncbi:hypothetical protein JCM12298_29410 [Desulfothermus naphthae]
MKKINILFTRSFRFLRRGGVTIYAKYLVKHLKRDLIEIINLKEISKQSIDILKEHSDSSIREKIKSRFFLTLFSLLFPFRILIHSVDIIHANPSFRPIPLIRDSYFILWAALLRRKIVVTIHGWDYNLEQKMLSCKYLSRIFALIYNLADVIFVLSENFKKSLLKLGIKTKIIVETNMVDDNPILENSIENNIKQKPFKKNLIILFLARIEKTKGIYQAIEAFKIVYQKFHNITLFIAGSGAELEYVKKFVKEQKIPHIKFLGYVSGKKKTEVFLNSDIYLFPSYHEGLPISVLEAMYFGLPVITRRVGGLKDFFINGKHGFITDSKDPKVFANYLEKLILDRDLRIKISQFNHNYAKEYFVASKVVQRIEGVYLDLFKESLL